MFFISVRVNYVKDRGLGKLKNNDYGCPVQMFEKMHDVKDVEEDFKDKNTRPICASIFNSAFFNVRDEEAISFARSFSQTQKELKEQNEELYNDIYLPISSGSWLNPYRKRQISLSNGLLSIQ